MSRLRLQTHPSVRLVGGIVVVGLGYWLLAQLGAAVQYTGGVEVAWLPVGFAAAMLYLGDLRWFIGATLGDLVLGTGVIPFHADVLVDVTTLQTVSNTVEFTLTAVLMRRWLGERSGLERPAEVGWLLLAIAIGTAIAAAFGALTLVWAGEARSDQYLSEARTWWLGDTTGGLLMAPLVLVWARVLWTSRWDGRRVLEWVLVVGATTAVSLAVFSSHHPLTYVVFPVLMLAAVSLGQPGATAGVAVAYVTAVVLTASNVGPFVEESITDEALNTQLYILVATLTTLMLGAAVSARRRAAADLAESQVDLAESRRREAEKAAQERQRIARDLHDSVSQTLFSLGLHAGIAKHALARAGLSEGGELPDAIDAVAELAHGALLEMRGSIFELRGDALTERGLVAALGTHATALAVRHDARVDVVGPQQRLPLHDRAEELLFRIGQEAMTNAVKHSGSATVSVQVTVDEDLVSVTVRDQGIGFDPSRTYDGHLGLELMRARATEAGGSATIDSARDRGTTVRVVVPVTAGTAAPVPPAPPAVPPASVS
jgi:signal transduction histidine kinase